uniref:RING-type domain-containing protein n=1 Tax=Ciona savignyi TaxID=51511 RepID=H2Y939_CIOSA
MGNQLDSDPERYQEEIAPQHRGRESHGRRIPKSSDRSKTNASIRFIPLSGSPKTELSSSLTNSNSQFSRNNFEEQATSNQASGSDSINEEEQTRIAQRLGIIQHLPRNTWGESHPASMKIKECCICMIDFEQNEPIRYLPCMHYYHLSCIDDWLMRSFTCPTCMEPVDAALLSTYDNQP